MTNLSFNPVRRLAKTCTRTLLLLCLPVTLAHSLPDDSDQPIHISADKAVRDEKNGTTVYSGNVQMNQGSMELEADTLTIYHPSDNAEKFVAEGKPAKMRQQPEVDKSVVHAFAGTIQYFKLEDRVHLQTDARIEQDGSVVNGDVIEYFIAKELIQAQSNASERVEVVIESTAQKDERKKSPKPQNEKQTVIETPPASENDTESSAEQEPQ